MSRKAKTEMILYDGCDVYGKPTMVLSRGEGGRVIAAGGRGCWVRRDRPRRL